MRPLKSSSSSLEVKFKFVDGSMCVVCVYVCVHVHLEFRDVSDHTVYHMILGAITKLTKVL